MPYIEVIPDEAAEGELREVYDEIKEKRGKLSSVLMIQSLNPRSIQKHVDLYMTTMFGRSPLKRAQREMIAVVVSSTNRCPYCVKHHAIALQHFWKDEERVNALAKDFRQAGLDEKDTLFCAYAQQLTREPSASSMELPDQMRAAGATDREIHDAALVTAYFNFVNRMVLGLGVQLEEEAGGFVYE